MYAFCTFGKQKIQQLQLFFGVKINDNVRSIKISNSNLGLQVSTENISDENFGMMDHTIVSSLSHVIYKKQLKCCCIFCE